MAEVRERRCAHAGCGCRVRGASDYCSAECARVAVGAIARDPCACGHAACHGPAPGATDS